MGRGSVKYEAQNEYHMVPQHEKFLPTSVPNSDLEIMKYIRPGSFSDKTAPLNEKARNIQTTVPISSH